MITSKQWFQIISGIVSGLITGAALLNPLFGEKLSLVIVSILGILNIVLSSIGAALSKQSDLVRDVLAMPGVEKIDVNEHANQTLSQLAVDPTVDKIAPTLEAQAAVTAKAAGP